MKTLIRIAAASAIAASAIVGVGGTASADTCTSTFQSVWFNNPNTPTGLAPVHDRPYGNSKVVGSIRGTAQVRAYCYNSHGNLWWQLNAYPYGYVWDGYSY